MEEIKAGDIMLNNWFIGYDGKPFQWKGYHFGMIENEVECVTIDEIIKSAIPLTEDILLKAGFKRNKFGIDPYNSSDGWLNYSFGLTIWNDGRLFYGWIGGNIEVKYLHQLQNLFKSLTGNDLKIEV
ncbi:hypothetical protein [Dysgonomonas sp. 37-18]|uniref:hypothetical protein n=1 Tax=Dysgonomonas sp. 37-18 TaxID=1895907 RepID=UPI000928C4F6|nr:hypothetical protein [Dysgonomonas sp. 37-18]OJX63079.1 MAG: hypothetical protein BGO84_14340 [Dysgonomonas sp. 37-18]